VWSTTELQFIVVLFFRASLAYLAAWLEDKRVLIKLEEWTSKCNECGQRVGSKTEK